MTLYTAQPGPDAKIEKKGATVPENEWLSMARDAYDTSTDYFDSGIRSKIERSIAHFQNRHAPGSKYYSEVYKYRARGFRPKTRTTVRKGEAEAAAAYFSTEDLVHIESDQPDSIVHRISAEINNELLNYRLKKTIPWFQLVTGAYQDALVQGVCVSYQSWDYRERVDHTPIPDDESGGMTMTEDGEQAELDEPVVLSDQPRIELRPVENIRFSPTANWIDPLNDSPYLVDRISMVVADVKAMMDRKTNPWHRLDDSQMAQGVDSDSGVRNAREHGREDSQDQNHAVRDFDTVWVHRNIIRKNQRDYIFYTLSTHHMLSDPIPLRNEYRHLREGERPYTMGYCVQETHKVYPASLVDISAPLQQEANDINNQRRDNVALVMQRRYFARRGANINYRQLMRSIPGSVTEMDDIVRDIRSEAPPEVTQSAYAEQDRVNMDYDELAGNFSTSSVSSNRQLNETVGGMEMMGGEANKIGEYQLRMFNETWVEKTLSQLVRLEQAYETDEAIFRMLGQKIKAWQRFGIDRITDLMIQGDMMVTVNVGIGATNPDKRAQRLINSIGAIANLAPSMMSQMDAREVASEIFGAAGYKSIDRFFPEENQQNAAQAPNMEMQKLQMQIEIEGAKLQLEQAKLQSAEQDREAKATEKQLEHQIAMMKLAQEKGLSLDQIKAKLSEVALKERGQNERFYAEKELALRTGSGI